MAWKVKTENVVASTPNILLYSFIHSRNDKVNPHHRLQGNFLLLNLDSSLFQICSVIRSMLSDNHVLLKNCNTWSH